MTEYQKERLTDLFYSVNDREEHDVKEVAKSIKRHIIKLMDVAYKLGWVDSGQKEDRLSEAKRS